MYPMILLNDTGIQLNQLLENEMLYCKLPWRKLFSANSVALFGPINTQNSNWCGYWFSITKAVREEIMSEARKKIRTKEYYSSNWKQFHSFLALNEKSIKKERMKHGAVGYTSFDCFDEIIQKLYWTITWLEYARWESILYRKLYRTFYIENFTSVPYTFCPSEKIFYIHC